MPKHIYIYKCAICGEIIKENVSPDEIEKSMSWLVIGKFQERKDILIPNMHQAKDHEGVLNFLGVVNEEIVI